MDTLHLSLGHGIGSLRSNTGESGSKSIARYLRSLGEHQRTRARASFLSRAVELFARRFGDHGLQSIPHWFALTFARPYQGRSQHIE